MLTQTNKRYYRNCLWQLEQALGQACCQQVMSNVVTNTLQQACIMYWDINVLQPASIQALTFGDNAVFNIENSLCNIVSNKQGSVGR